MDWYNPQGFEVGALFVIVGSDEVIEFLGASEIDGLSEFGVSPNVLVFRSVANEQLRIASELGYRRGECFERFVIDGLDED